MTAFEALPLDRTKPVPFYYQIAEILRRRIEDGSLKSGDTIPTEEELQALFGVSRTTVRQAVRQLVGEGLLRLERPHGTFVTHPKLQETLPALISFSDEIRQQGLHPTARVLEAGMQPAPLLAAQSLGTAEGAPTLRLSRLRLASDEPIALMYSHLAAWTGLDAGNDFTGSLHELLGRLGIRLVDADQIIEAASATAEQAHLLACRRGSALLKVDRVTFNAEGRGVEHVVALYRADRYKYRLRLSAAVLGAGFVPRPLS